MVPLGRWKGTQPLLDLVISCVFVFGRRMSGQDMAYSAYNHYRGRPCRPLHTSLSGNNLNCRRNYVCQSVVCYIRISKFQTLLLALCPCLPVVVVQIITVCCSWFSPAWHVRDRDIDWLCRLLFEVVVVVVVVIHLLNGELRVVTIERQKRIEMLWGHVGLQFVMNCAN